MGAKVHKAYNTWLGDEELLELLVVEHGAVVTSVNANGAMMDYAGPVDILISVDIYVDINIDICRYLCDS